MALLSPAAARSDLEMGFQQGKSWQASSKSTTRTAWSAKWMMQIRTGYMRSHIMQAIHPSLIPVKLA